MSDWSFKELGEWDDKICKIAEDFGLDWFPINYEVCDYYSMIGHMSYHGMPSHYRHWSFGKSFERTHQMYNLGMEGLPYELIINSNPSIAYLMRENPLYLQIIIMAHCVGHSDFFKNNRIFQKTRPEMTVLKFKGARDRIKKYIENPSIGIEKVERVLDAAHSIKFQINRDGNERIPHDKLKLQFIEKINSDKKGVYKNFNIDKIPIEKDRDLLGFIVEHGSHLEDWEKDILEIVKEESKYFMPQIKTKILNEGWASFWHYKILHELQLDSGIHLPFLKSHNQVIRPHIGAINPYHLGFHIFKKIEEKEGLEECFFVREIHDDAAGLRRLLDRHDCEDLNLFSYSKKKNESSIDDVSDEAGWQNIKNELIRNCGTEPIPTIEVLEIDPSGMLVLHHDHDGRDLELEYAERVVDQITKLWPSGVRLFTVIEEEIWEI